MCEVRRLGTRHREGGEVVEVCLTRSVEGRFVGRGIAFGVDGTFVSHQQFVIKSVTEVCPKICQFLGARPAGEECFAKARVVPRVRSPLGTAPDPVRALWYVVDSPWPPRKRSGSIECDPDPLQKVRREPRMFCCHAVLSGGHAAETALDGRPVVVVKMQCSRRGLVVKPHTILSEAVATVEIFVVVGEAFVESPGGKEEIPFERYIARIEAAESCVICG